MPVKFNRYASIFRVGLLAIILASVVGVQLVVPTSAQEPALTPPSTVVEPGTEPLTPAPAPTTVEVPTTVAPLGHSVGPDRDYTALVFVFMLATFIGLGVILRVSRLLHTPLMSLTNAISAIAVVGAIIVTGTAGHSLFIRVLGAVALFASMTNIVSGFLITDRMLKMFRQPGGGGKH